MFTCSLLNRSTCNGMSRLLLTSLKGVADDVAEQKEELQDVDKRVTVAEQSLDDVKTDVRQLDSDVTQLQTNVTAQSERVEQLEEDVEEIGEKVEEIDKKVTH